MSDYRFILLMGALAFCIAGMISSVDAQTALTDEEKLSVLPFQVTSEKVLSQSEVRWYFYLPIGSEGQGCHISYVSADGSILDKRSEQVTGFQGNTYYFSRTLTAGVPVVKWSGPCQLTKTAVATYKTVFWDEQVPDYDCSEVKAEEDSCILKGYRNETRTRTDTTLTPLKVSEPLDLSKAAALDICASTLVNITAGSLAFQNPTAANNSWVNRNWTEANVSIITDNLNTFKFNWNGTNTSLRGINCSQNMSYIDALGGYCIDQYEASVPGCDIVGSNSASYNQSGYVNTTYCIPESGVFGSISSDTGTTVPATSRPMVAPLVGVSQQQARQMCVNAGKHLCTSDEWLAAANILGQVYYLPSGASGNYIPYNNSNTTANCNTNSFCQYNASVYSSNRVCMTGNLSSCRSSEGVYDMVGNVWEWTNESGITTIAPGTVSQYYYINSLNLSWSSSSTVDDGRYGKDGTYFIGNTSTGRAVRRGGFWVNGAYAGLFAAYLTDAPSRVDSFIGFRCCSVPLDFAPASRTTYENTSDVFLNFSTMNSSYLFLLWTETSVWDFQQHNSTEWRFYANVTNLSSGTYSYYGWANDSAGNSETTGTYYLNVGEQVGGFINVSNIDPVNQSSTGVAATNFTGMFLSNYNSTANCDLLINDSVVSTIYGAANNTAYNFTYILPEGTSTWYWNCSTNSTQANMSEIWLITYLPAPPPVEGATVYLNSPANGSSTNVTGQTFMFNYTASQSPLSCYLYVNDSQEASDSFQNNTPSNLTHTLTANGTWFWFINCSNGSWSGVSETWTITLGTTTTTTTTTTTASTTTTFPVTPETSNSTDEMFAWMVPLFALIMTIATFFLVTLGNRPIVPALMSSFLWYYSSLLTVRVKHFGNFTITGAPYYISNGNPEIGAIWTAFAVIMGGITLLMVLDYLITSLRKDG